MNLLDILHTNPWVASIADDYGPLVATLLIISAYLLPFILIPFMIKSLSGAFGNLAGMVNDKSKGLLDRQNKWRGKKRQEKFADAKAGNRFKGNNAVYNRLNRMGGYASNIKHAGINPTRMRANMRAHLGDSHYEHALEQSEKLPGAKAFFSNDDLMMAGLRGEGKVAATRDYLRSKGYQGPALESAVSQVMNMRQQMGGDGFALAALTKLPATGTAYEEGDIGQWHNDIAKYTHGNKSLQGTIVAAGKAGFRASQRYEVSEAGFGDHMDAISMAEAGKDVSDITNHVVDKAYMSGGAQAVVASRNAKTAGMFAGAINRRLDRARGAAALAPDEEGRAAGEREILQQQAMIASIHEQSGSAKGIVGQVLADQLFNREGHVEAQVTNPNNPQGAPLRRSVGTGKSQLEEINEVRGNEVFRQMRRELTYSDAEKAEQVKAGASGGGIGGTPTYGSGLSSGIGNPLGG